VKFVVERPRALKVASPIAVGLAIVVACAASCAVDGTEYRFDEAQGGASALAAGGTGGGAPATGGVRSGTGGGTGGASTAGRSGFAGGSASGGAGQSASGGATSATGGRSAAATGGKSSTSTGGAAQVPMGGSPTVGGSSATGGGSSGSGGAVSSGGTASNEVNECAGATNPCLNGSKCTDTESGFTCSCLARYTGSTCEHLKFRGIGLVSGATASAARELSDDGTVAAGSATVTGGNTVPVRLNLASGAPLQSLGVPPEATGCTVTASNVDGTWLGGACLSLKSGGGFTWTPTDGPALAAVNVYRSVDFTDVTSDARVRIGTITLQEGADQQPFRWTTSTGFVPIEMPEAGNHYASKVSADGTILIGNFVGAVDGVTAARGFRWSTSSEVSYLPVSADFTNRYLVNGMSEDGKVIVGYGVSAQANHALRWAGSPLELEDLGPGFLMDCSADGKVLLGGNASNEIVIWEAGESRTLLSILGDTPDLAGWTLVEPVAISDDGKVIIGNGTHEGVSEGWVAHL
jgi:hypothetical protein